MANVLEILSAVCLVAGGAFCFAAGLGLVRFPDVFMRMHAATKAGTLGLGLIVLALVLSEPVLDVLVKAVLVAVFMIMTTPVGSHLIGRAAFRTGSPLWERTEVDPACEAFREAGEPEPEADRAGEDPAAAGRSA